MLDRTALIDRVLRYFHTLRYLKRIQFFYQGYHRFRMLVESRCNREVVLSVPRTGISLIFVPFIPKYLSFDGSSFSFLNLKKSFGPVSTEVNWNFGNYGKLWAYNLNYFDFLLQSEMDREIGLCLIDGFISGLQKGSVGLEPYPISLRGINWIKFLSLHHLRREDIDASLYAQYLMLNRNLEYHLLGNHLLENAFSLLFGACYFQEKSWFAKSCTLLQVELHEQVLDDGAHFELSPMYHQIILDRLLDCCNLLMHNQCFAGQAELLAFLREKAVAMIGWLKTVTFADGSIPHLNDATDGIAPLSHELFGYASRLGVDCRFGHLSKLRESGYRKFVAKNYECIVDIGHIGPDYIPGHAHADTLNFVLHVRGKPFLVDTGISTYQKDAVRDQERGSAAHNTVVVNGENSSDVWGGFRVGRRARVKVLENTDATVAAEHDGYIRFGVVHQREWRFETRRVVVHDIMRGRLMKVTAYFHFDHQLMPEVVGHSVHIGGKVISFVGAERVELTGYRQTLGFNRTIEAMCVIVHFREKLETLIKLD